MSADGAVAGMTAVSAAAELMRVAWRSGGEIFGRVARAQRAKVDLLDGLRRTPADTRRINLGKRER